jgi:hypothetical protein
MDGQRKHSSERPRGGTSQINLEGREVLIHAMLTCAPLLTYNSVIQMSILEMEQTGEGTPQGVVLLLVGPQDAACPKEYPDAPRTLRMYNLASLISLAKWTVAQKV